MITYKGERNIKEGSQKVTIIFSPDKVEYLKHRYVSHSPDGFNWGYLGSGPSDLSLNILYDYFIRYYTLIEDEKRKELSYQFHQQFKVDFISQFKDNWELTDSQISKWLIEKQK